LDLSRRDDRRGDRRAGRPHRASITFEVRDGSNCTVLSATTSNGKISIVDTGVFEVDFTRAEMQQLSAGTYDVGCVVTINGKTSQFLVGTLPVLDGVVSQ
jgi:hypothetical protein